MSAAAWEADTGTSMAEGLIGPRAQGRLVVEAAAADRAGAPPRPD
ncbi:MULTISPECIES: hypothetical protein [unclassified Streptomyces]